jgi:hypothetical protein
VAPRRSTDETPTSSPDRPVEASDMAVVGHRSIGEATETWVTIAGERQFVEVTLESAIRLHGVLGKLLHELQRP